MFRQATSNSAPNFSIKYSHEMSNRVVRMLLFVRICGEFKSLPYFLLLNFKRMPSY